MKIKVIAWKIPDGWSASAMSAFLYGYWWTRKAIIRPDGMPAIILAASNDLIECPDGFAIAVFGAN